MGFTFSDTTVIDSNLKNTLKSTQNKWFESDDYIYNLYFTADSEQSPPTLTISIAGFTVSLAINIIVISALRLRRR